MAAGQQLMTAGQQPMAAAQQQMMAAGQGMQGSIQRYEIKKCIYGKRKFTKHDNCPSNKMVSF